MTLPGQAPGSLKPELAATRNRMREYACGFFSSLRRYV
jgi:hypothetical protein